MPTTEEYRTYTSRAARFDVDTGTWSSPVDLQKPEAGDALLLDSGAALVGLGTSWVEPRVFWWSQRPGEQWRRHRMDLRRGSTTTLGIGTGQAVVLVMGRVVEARFLAFP